jgi:hypothetical protein
MIWSVMSICRRPAKVLEPVALLPFYVEPADDLAMTYWTGIPATGRINLHPQVIEVPAVYCVEPRPSPVPPMPPPFPPPEERGPPTRMLPDRLDADLA